MSFLEKYQPATNVIVSFASCARVFVEGPYESGASISKLRKVTLRLRSLLQEHSLVNKMFLSFRVNHFPSHLIDSDTLFLWDDGYMNAVYVETDSSQRSRRMPRPKKRPRDMMDWHMMTSER